VGAERQQTKSRKVVVRVVFVAAAAAFFALGLRVQAGFREVG